MNSYSDKINFLVALLDDHVAHQRYSFNPLEEFHASENAHTRVLVALLKIPDVCSSFLRYFRQKFPSAKLWFEGCETARTAVCCFSDYIDASITVGEKTAIIENKINGAEDQDSQIDRYVESKALASSNENILVFYLTLDGSKIVSDKSFKKSKVILEYKSHEAPGRFLAINYKDHILDWLKNSLEFSIEDLAKQPVLYSGVVQYIDYLEGNCCLALRGTANENDKDVDVIRNGLKSDDLNIAVSTLTEYEQLKALFRVKHLNLVENGRDGAVWEAIPVRERAWALKTAFCKYFSIDVPDDEPYAQRPTHSATVWPTATVAIGKWVDTSLVQIDFWFDGNGDSSKYREEFNSYKQKIRNAGFSSSICYDYNEAPAVRCLIDNPIQLKSVLDSIGEVRQTTDTSSDCRECSAPNQYEKWLRLEKPLAWVVRNRAQNVDSEHWPRWKRIETDDGSSVDYSYSYMNGWAIQLSENFTSELPIRAIEFFPARNIDTTSIVRELHKKRREFPFRCYRWDKRTVFQFPVATENEAKRICSFLNKLRNNTSLTIN